MQRHINNPHRHITGPRDEVLHQVSRTLVRQFTTLSIEALNVAGMDKLRCHAKIIRDVNIGGLLQKINYKAAWYGTTIVAAGQWFSSSRTCAECGLINPESKRESRWTCPSSGSYHDRNLSAARNLHKLALLAVREPMLPDGEALSDGVQVAGETNPDEGRTRPATLDYTQLRLGL